MLTCPFCPGQYEDQDISQSPNQRTRSLEMNTQLAKEAALREDWNSYWRPSSPDARRRYSNALPALAVGCPLRTSSMPHLEKPTAAPLFSRCQTSAACAQGSQHLPEDAAIANHRTVEDIMRDWDNAEQRLTSAFFLMWALGVMLLGGWHVANHFSESVAHLHVVVAVLAATCTPVAFSRIKSQGSDTQVYEP